MRNGEVLTGKVGSEDTLTLYRDGRGTTVKMGEILWLAGDDMKRIRLTDIKRRSDLLSGTVDKAQVLNVRTGDDKTLSLVQNDIAFYFKEAIDLSKIGRLAIEESNQEIRMIQFEKAGHSSFNVTVLPQKWAGPLDIVNPVFSPSIPCSDKLSIRFALTAKNSREDLHDLFTCVLFESTPKLGTRATTMACAPKATGDYSHVVFAERDGTCVTSGKVDMYLFVVQGIGAEECGGGKAKIVRTVSNVLRLPIEVRKP